ncbi:VanZ family protein [Effusibacillus pohliae]|uniref:VanZ family protein n=1 Tax=Effusibacillus pohliae TaxID=232270 RepID=UPI00035DA6EC|nr:VanZ family protein [Effusibacillus pohliae]
MLQKNWRAYVWFALTLAFMALIFLKSAEPYAQQDLKPKLAAWISASALERWLPHIEFYYDHDLVTWKQPYGMLEFFIRKAAHVSEYAILTFLWIRTLAYTSLTRCKILLASACIALLYAASDEWHQTFVPGRTGHPIDVAVDSLGIALIVLIGKSA